MLIVNNSNEEVKKTIYTHKRRNSILSYTISVETLENRWSIRYDVKLRLVHQIWSTTALDVVFTTFRY